MHSLPALLAAMLLLPLLAPPARAAEAPSVINDAHASDLRLRGDARAAAVRARADSPTAVRITTPHRPPNIWDVQLSLPNAVPIARGDTLHLTLRARSVESPMREATFEFNFETAGPPHHKSAQARFSVGEEWTDFSVPFRSIRDYAPGEALAAIQLGFGPQTIEIDALRLVSYAGRLAPEDLPQTRSTYHGREPDAPWRAEAAERIDRLRKADLTLRVLDASGAPVPNARVEIRQTRHAFPFGTAVTARDLASASSESEAYRRKVAELFNEAVFENAMKWEHWGLGDPEQIDAALAWLDEHDIPVRGHCLVWPGRLYMPKDALAALDDPRALRELTERRVRETAARYAGRLIDWDVLNEPVTNRDIQNALGDDAEADWFAIAREADPNAVLYVNDFGLMTEGDADNPKLDAYEAIIRRILDAGAPLGGIGMQGHFATAATPPEELWKIWDRFAALGLPIKVTELDMAFADRDLQADYMRDFLTAAFAHPAVTGVLHWGFWEHRHWRPEAALFAADWTPRPHGQAYIDLVFGAWTTRGTFTTDAEGLVRLRAFKGDYEITAGAAEPFRLRLEDDLQAELRLAPSR